MRELIQSKLIHRELFTDSSKVVVNYHYRCESQNE
uniref:Uncharacterized protein n=1 Tax=Arundo donax TaxID=35708 RepID=A0A0A8ZDL6_ARUDO